MFKLKLFIIIEILLALIGFFNIVYKSSMRYMFVFSVLLIVWGAQRLKRYGKGAILLTLGTISLLILFLSSPIFWLLILVAMFYFLFMKKSALQDLFFHSRRSLDFFMIETIEPQKKSNRRARYKWIGQNNIGQETYEWDDINLFMLAGDIIIDLKETLLPKEDSVITLQIIFGRVRIIIPSDIGVHVIHYTLIGELYFDEDRYKLRNESVDIYSENYDEAIRHLKILTNVGFGEIEVIHV
ncbi:MAG: cell wall-active antibiotics response protein LiaF [Streptococcaceae bacterium]|jgi:predicted membrane protein|nr:cell wall-active antibiotics response protein LiaF [Streptococcaceae bacterium]